MAGKDGFKYIINAELRLNKGSLNTVLAQISEMDKGIKDHFGKSNGGVKVPLVADKDITRLQKSVSETVERYNKGQAPTIKVKVVPDEQSINKLQQRIAEVRKQLNSLSDAQAKVSVNTSLVVGRNEKEEVQKQVEGINPTIEVKVIANEDSLKQMKAQIEAIKAEVQATVNAVQNAPDNMRRIGAHRNQSNTSSVGRTSTNRKINVPRSQVDRFVTDRKAITDEINAIQANIKLLEKEAKLTISANEIQKRIDSLQQAQTSGTATKWNVRDDKGHIIKGTKTVKAENFDDEINYYKSMLKQVDGVNSLKKQLDAKLKQRDTLERTVAYKSPSKNKPTPRSHISTDSSLGQAVAEIDAQRKAEQAKQDALDKAEKQRQAEVDKAEKKRQADTEKADKKRQSDAERNRIRIQRDNERTLKRNRQITYNRLNRGRGSAETQDRRIGYQQHLEDMPNRYVSLNETKSIMQARVNQLKDLTGGTSNGKTGAEKRAQYSPQALVHVQSLIDRLNSDIKALDDEINIERAKLQSHVSKLYGNDTQGRKLQQTLLSGSSKVNPNEVLKAQVKTQTVANVKAENDAKIKAWEQQKAQEELEKQWSQTGAYSELPSNGRIAKLMARNQARQAYLDRKTQSVSQAKNDYDTHTRRYGGNREYAGTDLEAILKDPNVSLQDSLRILKNQINPMNVQSAVSNRQNFQKAYSISYKDNEGNIRNIRTLTYEYTKFGEAIERGDKSFGATLKHIGERVGVFSLLEGAMFGVVGAFARGIEDMAKFDAQLAEVVATTKDLNAQGNQLQQFYQTVGGTSSMESQVQNDTFKNAETYGVSALNTVMPIEQQVIARHNLVSGNSGYDSSMKDQIVKKIMEFSAISTGGEATPEETNDLTKDSLSLYQAYYDPSNPTNHIDKMNGVFDNLTAMRMRGVNTTAVADALAELAPDTITAGVDSRQVMSMMGAYNLSDASATGDDIQTISRTFFGALRHADTNDNLKNALSSYMGIDLNSQSMSTPQLLNKMLKTLPELNDAQLEQFSQAFSGTSGKGVAMTPKMVKFLKATQGQDYSSFMQGDNSGAMEKSWLPFSERLKTNFDNLVEKLQEFTQLLGRLGVLDSLGILVGGFSKILDVVNNLLRGVQKLSDFFGNHNLFNIPKFTLEILAFQGAVKGLVGLLNKAKFGGALGDLLAGNMFGRFLGVKTTEQRTGATTGLGETVGSFGPVVNMNRNMSNDTSRVTRTVAQDTEKVATQSAESATKNAVNVMSRTTLKNSADSMLRDVLTFTTADVLANKLKRNPAMKDITQTVETSSIPKTITSPTFERTALDATIATTAKRETMSTGGRAIDSIGSFMSDALMIGMLRGKGGAEVAGKVVKGGSDIVGKITTGFIEMLPALRGFGLLLTRISLIGAVITAGIWTVQALVDRAKKVAESEQAKTQKNMDANLKDVRTDTTGKAKKKMNINIDQWLGDNKELLKLGRKTQVNGDYNYKDLQERAKLSTRLQNMKDQYGLEYTTDSKGRSVIHYDNGKKTATVGNKKEMQAFRDFYNNGGATNVQKLSDAWKVSTDNLKEYQNELVMVNVLSKNLAETMRQIDLGQKAVDAQYAGVTSSGSLKAKIDIAQQGLDKSQNMGMQLQARADDISLEHQRSTDKYNSETDKALKTGVVSQSDIENAIQQLEVAKANNQSPQTVFDSFKTLDPTKSEDAKVIKEKGYSKSELKDLNTKNSAINAVLQTYQQYSGTQDLYNQSQDALDGYKSQMYQFKESITQMKGQLMVAKLGLDAMTASLQNLSAVASASKVLVDMNENVLNTGDNHAQIGALHSSMQVSSAQMSAMLSQQSVVQNAMNKIKSDNPNQDFSLSAIYDPQGGVSKEQIAYKTLYEQNQQMTQNISSQSSTMYSQVQQLRDLVFNSNEYADSWQRIQQTVQDVKDSIKSTNDFQYQMASVNENSLMTAGTTGQKLTDVRQQQLQAIRDNSLQITTKLTTDKASFSSDISNLNKAWTQIMNEEGTNFKESMTDPLKGIVGNFGNAVGEFGKDVSANNTNMQNAINQMNQAVSNAQSQALNSASQSSTGSFGGVSNTGQTIQSGQFSEKNYDAEMSPYAKGKYAGQVGAFVQAGAKYGVPPELLLAIAMSENSGSSNILNNSNNVGNIKATGSSPEWGGGSFEGYRAYSSLQQGINDLAHLISEKISSGYNTIPLINKHYAEDPNWMNNVASYMGKMTGTSASTWLGNATVNSGFNIGGSSSGSSSSGGGGGSSSYTGTSIVDYLSSIGQSTSFSHRQQLANQYGISGYSGTASQNLSLLSKMRSSGGGGGGSSAPSSAPAGGGVANMFSWYNSVLNKQAGQGGLTYQWGGAHVVEDWNTFISKAAADCSGLVEQVYKQFAGINLGTTSSAGLYSQNDGGTKVSSKSQLQPGDLVFFGSSAGSIHHVGVYAGDNQMYTIDHDGMPVTKENLWSDYYGGKHYNIPTGGGTGAIAGSPQASVSAPDPLATYKNQQDASVALVQGIIPQMVQKINNDIGQALVNGNIADVMGTSGITAKFDRIAQARQDIGAQMISNHDQIDALNQTHDMYVNQLNSAYARGDVGGYNTAHAYLAYTDELIYALQQNTSQLQALDATYKSEQQQDPRLAGGPASMAIEGGINTLRLFNDRNQTGSVDYFRVANELGTMQNQYMTSAKETSLMKNVFDTWGQQGAQYSMYKNVSDENTQNVVYTQLKTITGVLNGFATGTQQWYSALQTTVEIQKQIRDLEQQRLTDAQSNFENTGTGSQAYIEQRAYVQSRDYSNNAKGLQDAISTYKNGYTGLYNNGYGIQMPSWDGSDNGKGAAQSVADYLFNKYQYSTNVVNAEGGWTVRGDANLSQDKASTIFNDLYGSKIGAGWVTGGGYGIQMPSWYGDQASANASTVQKYIQDTWGYGMQLKPSSDGLGGYTLQGQDNLTQQNATDIFNDIMGKYIGAGWVKTPNMYDTSKSYGLSTQNFSDENGQDAQNAQHYMGLQTGVQPTWVQDQQGGGHWQADNLTNNQATNLDSLLKEFGYSSGNTVTSSMDFNQQLANLQIIADTHNKMTQQMTDYKQSVTDAFKAGALSIDDYIAKLNQLRDVQTEQKESAVNMVGNVQSGFSSALSDALTQGMQGAINSPVSFMNSIKSTLSSSISGQLTSTLLNNTGLQDVMNKISTSIATASTSGSPSDIVNMFNNNDFGKQMQDAIAPFLPMIQQIVGSTKGIFTILKDQVYNAPSGFKVDNYMNEIANSVGYQGIKTMNPNINSVGSPTLDFNSGGQIQTTTPSTTPTGIPTGVSTPSNGTTGPTGTGAPEGTTGAGTGAPDTSGITNAPATSSLPWQSSPPTPPPPPPPPAPSATSTYTVVSGDTLSGIGAKLHVDWHSIASLNGIGSPYRIYPGEVLRISGGSSGGSSGGGSSSGTKHTSSSLNFRSSPSYGKNVMGSIPKGAAVSYYGLVSGWAKVGYNGKTGYVGPSYLYHTGGIAGVTNFASGQGLKPNELSAILQKSETIFQPRQLDDLVNGAMQAGVNSSNSGGGVNVNVTVNFSGDVSEKATIEETVQTAVQKALSEFKKTTRLNNLSWKGTSY